MPNKKILLLFSVLIILGCGNLMNRVREGVWLSMPYAVDKGMADPNRRLSFITKEKSYTLVDSVLKIGYNDKYLVVLSYKGNRDSLQYWIVDKSIQELDRVEKKENVEGPLDSAKFNYIKRIHNIDTLEFTVEIK
jgi:hypothetical protein